MGQAKGRALAQCVQGTLRESGAHEQLLKGSRDVLHAFKLGSLVCPFREFGLYPVAGY